MPSFLSGVNTELPEAAAQSDLRPKPPDEAGPPHSKTARNLAISVVVLLVIGGFLSLAIHKKGATLRDSQTPVRSEAVEPTLRLKGTTEAIQDRGILAPALTGEQTGSLTI